MKNKINELEDLIVRLYENAGTCCGCSMPWGSKIHKEVVAMVRRVKPEILSDDDRLK